MKKLSINEFIEKAKKIHGDKYNYSKFIYINSQIKGIIICPTHGEFLQTPNSHLRKSECPICGNQQGHQKQTSNINIFIKKARQIHGLKYDYSKSKYINNKIKIEIICPHHGSFFQKPNNHISLKHGCFECGRNITLSFIIKNTDDFIQKANLIHNNLYDYSKVNYIRSNIPVEIICKKHGSFFQKPNNHLNGNECPKCKCGYKVSKSQIEFLNYLNLKNQNIILKEWKRKKVDGYDPKTNTIYEFLGDYWHGNPEKYNLNNINKNVKRTFGYLYQDTFKKFDKLKSFGYNIKYIWELDWNRFKEKETNIPRIIDF